MLFPQSNRNRQVIDLSGIWDFAVDPEDAGVDRGWQHALDHSRPVAVPASWNDQFAEWRDYLGPAWYQTHFYIPSDWRERRIHLRFGSVNYHARAWLNGGLLGAHEGGHLPFEFDITELARPEGNRLVVRVDGRLGYETVPPGDLALGDMLAPIRPHPNTNFDFFPYSGVHRPVLLYSTPIDHLQDVTVTTEVRGERGVVRARWDAGASDSHARIHLSGFESDISLDAARGEAEIEVHHAALWSPQVPNLYRLTIDLLSGDEPVDSYSLPVGIRSVRVESDALLLNGEPVTLRGFGRHEDFPVYGRGYAPPVIVKDFDLMRWVGANSFRTSHYPYAEQQLALADRLGFLVIDETPAVGLFFQNERDLEKRNTLCRSMLSAMIQRDKNHPSVIMWSLANEPLSDHPRAMDFFRELYLLAHELDDTRPVTLVRHMGALDDGIDYLDVTSLNLYFGWYQQVGRLENGFERLSQALDFAYERYRKPVLLTEFGADTIPGHHAQPPEMFSEEYQAELIAGYLKVLDEKPYVVGAHIWNLCDFKTGQALHRMSAMNYKGVFTRDRRPKLAAHRLREIWRDSSEAENS